MEAILNNILNKEQIKYDSITKTSSGFTSNVFFIDNKYVIKLSNEKNIKQKIDKEISIYQNLNFDFIPKYITSGIFKDYKYLIISKLEGKSLYSIWNTLDENTKENIVKQIANILNKFHKTDYSFLNKQYYELDWKNLIASKIDEIILKLNKLNIDSSEIQKFINDSINIFDKNQIGLCYNDAHFDNFIYYNNKVYLIDFDRVKVCPIDYEMMIFKTMCDNPQKFANEEDEKQIKLNNFKNLFSLFKKYYPDLFKIKNIEKRIAIYQYIYLINQAINNNDTKLITKANYKLLNN